MSEHGTIEPSIGAVGEPAVDTIGTWDFEGHSTGRPDWAMANKPVQGAQPSMAAEIESWCNRLSALPVQEQIEALNAARRMMHAAGPFSDEPVDCVVWIPVQEIGANDYNPNSVAPPEMELLRLSIAEDGYTQPIVSWNRDGAFEVVDGFHRYRIGREDLEVAGRIHGRLPLTVINANRQERGDRIASTIRHNRARGKHAVAAMSEIVVELKRRNWSDTKIGRELGMDPDEVLRLSQISGLAEMFSDREFSEAWEATDPLAINEDDTLDDADLD